MTIKKDEKSPENGLSENNFPDKEGGGDSSVHEEDNKGEKTVNKDDGGSGEDVLNTEPQDTGRESAEEMLGRQYAEVNDKYLRLYSEFDNYRRRTAKERLDLLQNAAEDIIRDLLPVLDDFERAIESGRKTDDFTPLKQGIEIVYKKFSGILAARGLESMEAMDKPFNTDWHEAITHVPAVSKKKKGKIVDVIEKGYLLNGRVIRYAKVVVGN